MCEDIGVAYQSQHEKLRSAHWATITNIVTVAEDGKARDMSMLRADCIAKWLSEINPNKSSRS